MNTLVIGGTGFIGEYLCRALVQDGVIVVARPGMGEKEKIVGVLYEEIDLDKNFLELKKILNEVEKIVWAIQPDIERMQNILSVIEEFGNIKKIVYLSTLLVYPDSVHGQNEDVVTEPKTDYEKAKFEEEKILEEFVNNKNCHLCIARLGNVYGDVKNRGVINQLMLSLLNDTPFNLSGDGKNVRDYIFVEDAAGLLAGLVRIDNASQIEKFNVCVGNGYSISGLIGLLEDIASKKIKILSIDKIDKSKSVLGDNQKVAELLNWSPNYSLTEGLKKTYNNYSKYYKFN